MKTSTEFYKKEFGEAPKTKEEKLMCAMMTEYAEYRVAGLKKQLEEQIKDASDIIAGLYEQIEELKSEK